MERKITKDQVRLAELINNVPIGMLVVTRYGLVEMVNATFRERFGYRSGQIVGKPVERLLTGFDWKSLSLQDLFKKKSPTIHAEVLNGENRPISVEIDFSTVLMPEGRRLLVSIQDVTERRQLERMKADFVATVTHDLKTPLTSIRLFHQLLAKQNVRELFPNGEFDASQRSIDRLLQMVDDLLDLERIAARKLQLHLVSINPREAIDEAVETVLPLANNKNVTLTTHVVDTECVADRARIVQVLINLLSNAIKFSNTGESVTITAFVMDGEWLQIEVHDTGRGIPKEFQQSIFDRFKQINPSDQFEKHGTGLGLPICKGIVEQHGGAIGVISELGEGTTFWFRLPAKSHLD